MAFFPQKSLLAPLRSASVRNRFSHLMRSMGKRAGEAAALLTCGARATARAFREITSTEFFFQPAITSRWHWEARIIA